MGYDTLCIPQPLARIIQEYCETRMPFESGGLVFGRFTEQGILAERFYGLETALFSSVRFIPKAESVLCALATSRYAMDELVATVHSHPSTDPVPSRLDLNSACGYASMKHIIIGFSQAEPQWRAFSYNNIQLESPSLFPRYLQSYIQFNN